MVRSGRRTLMLRSRSPWKACGDVTSWTRWRSMKSSVGAPSWARTTWESHSFSMIVLGIDYLLRKSCTNSGAHLLGGRGSAFGTEVGSHMTAGEDRLDRLIHGGRFRFQPEAVGEH